ncbi:RNA-directed DNA polymerase, eukaryota, Reverse transcriptase zinc-binding domain protein [Melia azedarach]|uniref:RNA-directed DNA polymerase, eukaryota, Reverse transcriptase zinc-binding domain protein n=1 Tax=Melia azedarach TaxID=155640 RepID=A0ACC1Y5Y5_MELAZ|nr:RNA-directed DNA polymerase, eukaryota, Reverse transcriptase zinc-binding domain protein [Melia azedarach]
MWLFHNVRQKAPLLTTCTNQHIAVQVNMNGQNCIISFIYASTSYVVRRQLWQELQNTQTQLPWVVLGDFNAVLGFHEKLGGNLPSTISCAEFGAMIDSCDLLPKLLQQFFL